MINRRLTKIGRSIFLLVILLLTVSVSVDAKIGVMLMESIPGTAGYVAQGGHSTLFLSETCTDDYVSMRPCTEADPVWGVIAERTASFSSKAEYDWLVMPVSVSLFALEQASGAPLLISPQIRKKLIEKYYFSHKKFRDLVVNSDPEFEKGMELEKGFRFPKGRWQNFFGSQLRRSTYVVWINDVSGTRESELVTAINGFSNRPKFNTLLFLFAGNCSRWVQQSLLRIEGFKEAGFGSNWAGDGVFSSPKGVTEEAFNAARKIMAKNPDVFVTVELIPQVPGTYPKSDKPYYVIESVFKNKLVWPVIAFFHPIVYLIGRFYFRFIKRFSIHSKYAGYFNQEAASLSIESEGQSGKGRKEQEMNRLRGEYFGEKSWWKQKKREFRVILEKAKSGKVVAKMSDVEKGRLLKRLVDKDSDVELDGKGVPWLVKPGVDGKTVKAGLTLDTVAEGNFVLGFRIMLARIGWHLKQKNLETRLSKQKFQAEWNKLLEFVDLLERREPEIVAGNKT